MLGHWRKRAIDAEAQLVAAQGALALAKEHLTGIELRFEQRANLVSIARNGRMIRWGFLRNGELHYIETMGMWSDDVDGWKQLLLEKVTTDGNQS